MTDNGSDTPAGYDADAAAMFAFRVWTYKQGELVALMIHLGDRLGLYKSLDGAGPCTAAELGERTGHQPTDSGGHDRARGRVRVDAVEQLDLIQLPGIVDQE